MCRTLKRLILSAKNCLSSQILPQLSKLSCFQSYYFNCLVLMLKGQDKLKGFNRTMYQQITELQNKLCKTVLFKISIQLTLIINLCIQSLNSSSKGIHYISDKQLCCATCFKHSILLSQKQSSFQQVKKFRTLLGICTETEDGKSVSGILLLWEEA